MPRLSRNKSKTNFHHVMVQGINKEYIFKDEEHIIAYKNIILNKLKDSNITILAYCIMNNHAHFLIHNESSENLSKFMQKINTSYSHFYNTKHKRVGYVFRDRFRSQDILNQKQLYTCLNYIHNNPIKAKIVKNLYDYKYSSYIEFLEKKEIITQNSIKLLFNETNNYMDKFKLIHASIMDEKYFIDIKDTKINDFITEFETTNNIQMHNLKNNPKLLKKFIAHAREETDVKIVELAQIIGISKSSVGNIIKKIL